MHDLTLPSHRIPSALVVSALILSVSALGCLDRSDPGAEEDSDPAPVVRVVEEPDFTLGALSGPPEVEFESVQTAVVVEDSVLAVLDSGARELRFFDLGGRFLKSVGGPGEGPGEFGSTSRSWIDDDGGLSVYDATQRRVTSFSSDGEFQTSSGPTDPAEPGQAMVDVAGRMGERWIILLGDLTAGTPPPGETLQHTTTVALLGPEGKIVEGSELQLPSVRWYTTDADQPVRLPLRYSPVPRATVWGGTAAVLDPEGNRVLVLDGSGTWSDVPLPDRCGFIGEDYLAEIRSEGGPLASLSMDELRATEPECPPAWDGIEITGDGRIWVRGPESESTSEDGEDRDWVVIDLPDRELSEARLPENFVPKDIHGGVLYGRWVDSLGVHYVRGYRLRAP